MSIRALFIRYAAFSGLTRQIGFDLCHQAFVIRCDIRCEPCDDLAISADEEFLKIPKNIGRIDARVAEVS